MFCKHNRLALAIGALLTAGLASSVFAQSTQDTTGTPKPTSLTEVVVTGSHIKSAALSGVSPVTVIDAEAIQRSGATSVETLLQRLPASAGFAGNQTNAYWADNGYGTTQVNLRGLGPNRTLVLLNGRRIVSGGTGANSSVDLNTIPVALIERIEVLKDGASAIYGADAVAGVVNIITKKNFNGAEASIRYGQTTRDDGGDGAFDLAWGITTDRGSLMTAINFAKSGAINMADRQPCGLAEVDGKLECRGSSTTIGGRALLPDGRRINFNQDPNGDPRSYHPYSAAKDNQNVYSMLNAVNPIERLSFSTFGNLSLADNTKVFTELMYTNRQSHQLATPSGLGIYRPIHIAATNPTNPTGQDLLLQRRSLKEAGTRDFFQEVNTFRTVVGIEGKLATYWDWSVAVNWGRNTGIDGSTNVVNLDRLDQTLDTSICSNAPGAAIPCGNYLGAGSVTREVLDYILYTGRDTGGNDQKSFTANISGQAFNLPAGPFGIAAGIDIRRERGWRDPDQLTVLGIGNTNKQDPIAGGNTAKEAFTEVLVPLLRDKFLVDSLTLSAALRYSKYDLFGADNNYKVGLDWQLVPSLKVRANYATAFRIPNIPELFGGVSEGGLTTTDPCSNWSGLPPSSVVYKNCQLAGVPVGYVQLGNAIQTTVGGNRKLRPEDAKTLTAGFVWTPTFAGDLTVTADYFNIRIENAIQRIAGSTKLAICYNSPNLSHQFCSPSSFTRNKLTGEVDFLSSQPVNAANERVAGVDIGTLYQFDLAGMKAGFSLDITYLKNYDVRPFPGAEEIRYAGKITGGRGSYPHWRSFGSLTLAQGPWSGYYSIQYIGATDDINAASTDIGAHVSALTYHNAQLKYSFSKALNVAFGIDNIWDKKAPFVSSYTDANTDTMTYDLMGRRWNAKLTYRW